MSSELPLLHSDLVPGQPMLCRKFPSGKKNEGASQDGMLEMRKHIKDCGDSILCQYITELSGYKEPIHYTEQRC